MNTNKLSIRKANELDCQLIFDFLNLIADNFGYKLDSNVNVERIKESYFIKKDAEVLIGEINDYAVSFSVIYKSYSSSLCIQNLYIEELFVIQEYRKLGIGTKMFQYILALANSYGCKRLDWMCLKNNGKAISFYQKLGAKYLDEWVHFRLSANNTYIK